ncbi:MAG TPA: YidC/Oxa1 family membrane protein insertase [Gemmatimonadaceae bacterium]|nr:YidC/Oxa1 family membrane protein insertase [Gemmatimonadaceae bacterium]
MWDGFVELIRVTIVAVAHVCGGSLGAGVMAVSVAVRIALLPLTLRVARQAREQHARLLALKPEIERLQRRYAHDPARLMRETRALYAAKGIRLLTPGAFVSLLVQMPLLSGLFAATRAGLGARVRFLWIGNLALPDPLLTVVVSLLTAGTMILSLRPQGAVGHSNALVLAVVGAGATLLFLWSASSAVALSLGAGSLVSGAQSWILARDGKRPAPSA